MEFYPELKRVVRVAGSAQPLLWDVFCYSVIVSNLKLSFCNPWWIPYEITCTVQEDLAQTPVSYSPTLADSVVNDLTEVSQLLGSSVATSVGSVISVFSSGSAQQQQALSIAAGLQTSITQGVLIAGSELDTSDVGSLVAAAGSLAQLCCAQGYLDRSITNITSAG